MTSYHHCTMHSRAVLPLFIVGVSLMLPQRAPAQTPSAVPKTEEAAQLPRMPSEEEIGDLLSKASEYVQTYRQVFTSTKPSLDKAATPGFYAKGMELSTQASGSISAIRKNGSSAYALVALIAILDDMSLNGARASAATTLVALKEDRADPKNHAMDDFLSLAQAEKNCYDISELLLHTTLRYIAREEAALQILIDQQKH